MTTETETTVAKTTAPTEETQTQTVTKEFTFELTQDETRLKARELQTYRKDIAKETADFEERKQNHKATITRLENNITRTITLIAEGKETRPVECIMTKHFNEGTVRYTYQGTLMEERPLTQEERQLEMGPTLVKGRRNDTGSNVPGGNAQNAGTGHTDRSEIEQAIREETSARTKHSAVDGPIGTPEEVL